MSKIRTFLASLGCATLSIVAPGMADAGAAPHAVERMTGTAVAASDECALRSDCLVRAVAYSFTLNAVRSDERNWQGYVHFCDLHSSTCSGVVSQRDPFWTILHTPECWTVTPPIGQVGATIYGGTWFSAYDADGELRERWWSFKIVDNGLGGVDRIGIKKFGPVRDGANDPGPIEDGACGALKLATAPVLAGDLQYASV